MIASDESITQETSRHQARWLVLFHQLPPKPAYLRVKIRRRLQRIGAVALKNSVYVLPFASEALEDFQWLRREIVDAGGEATLCASQFLEGMDDALIEALFRSERAEEYGQVLHAAQTLGDEPGEGEVERLRTQFGRIVRRDYFHTPEKTDADDAIAALEARRAGGPEAKAIPSPVGTGAVWATRRGIFVDRIASAWLIARFIDPAARFKFVAAEGYVPDPGERRFDMFEGEFTHEGERCTFETLLARFGLRDRALTAIAEIVHDIDCKDEKFGRAEADGIRTVLQGITATHPDDAARLAFGRVVFDGLYAQFRAR